MKYAKIFISICIILALTSCKLFKKTSSEEEVHPLVGVWNFVEGTAGLLITTNSNQTANNPDKSTGTIEVTGKYQVTFDYIYVDYFADPPDVYMDNSTNTESYYLAIDGSASTNNGYLQVSRYDTYQDQNFTGNIDYTFDKTTLVITHSTLTDTTNGDTVVVNGTIVIGKINLPANTPTLMENEDIFENFTQQWEFKEDNSFIQTITDEWGTYADTAEWNVSGNVLTMIFTYDDGWSYTQTLDYSIDGNNLELIEETDICGDWFGTKEECLTYLETALNIDPGSLKEIVEHYEMAFTKAAVKQKLINNNVKPIRQRHPYRKQYEGIFDKLKFMN